jgi:UDP-4-amino-4,6-dideoxy-N-acetyl-beta-L-altrosamine N-acetyltransferase
MASLRLLTPQDESMILDWRNSDAVAPYMLRDTLISKEEHHRWFGQILHDTDSAVFRIMEHEGVSCGLASLSAINLDKLSGKWGGYLAPHVPRGSGLGKTLMYLSLTMAFSHLGLNLVQVEVIVGNDAAIGLYDSIGFIRGETIFNRAEHKNGPADVIAMSLKRVDWNLRKDDARETLITNNLITE